MTILLAKAFEEASRLSEEAQNEIAERLLEEIEGEERWDATLASTPDVLERLADVLERLADKALEDFKAGRTKKLGFDDL
jgi:hypothetical protein